MVRGKVNGNINAKEKIEIKSKAELFGDIRATKLVIEEGVTYVGKTEVNPNKVAPTAPPARSGETPKTPEPARAGTLNRAASAAWKHIECRRRNRTRSCWPAPIAAISKRSRATAFSTICKKCGQHLRVQEILNPPPKAPGARRKQKHITCFECGAELDSAGHRRIHHVQAVQPYVDLHDYRITSAIAKNFKTKGAFVVEPKGYVFNTETIVGDAVIRGKFHGKLAAEGSLTIYSTADIKGSLTAAHLIIPAENHFRWPDPIKVGSAEIAGELAANLRAQDTVTLKSTARLFGNVDAKDLVVEDGAVVVGKMQIGPRTGNEQSSLL